MSYRVKKEPKKQNANIKPLHKRKVKAREMNAGGFYEGMPGAIIDEYGNRSMIHFVITPDGLSTCYMNSHPKLSKNAIQEAMKNQMVKGIVYGAVIDDLFSSKNPLNWPLKFRFMVKRFIAWTRSKIKANRYAKQLKSQKKTGEETQDEG